MAKDATYHRSAVTYNEEFMKFASEMADRVDDPEVKKWCQGIAKQHEFHLARHQKALKKMENRMSETQDDEPTETPAPADPAPTANPVESTPDPEQAAEPVEAGVGTPETTITEGGEGIFVNERAELDFRSAGEVVGEQSEEKSA